MLAEHFRNIDAILSATKEDFEAIDGFGGIMALSAAEFFSLPETIQMIEKFKALGLNMNSLKIVEDERFKGMTFDLTGTLPTYSRAEASALIEKFGGKTSSSVSKNTSYVLAGEEAGSKLEKAQSLGVAVIDEQEFNNMIS